MSWHVTLDALPSREASNGRTPDAGRMIAKMMEFWNAGHQSPESKILTLIFERAVIRLLSRILCNIWSNQMKQMKIPEIIKKLPYKMRVSFKDIIDEKSWWGEKFKIRLRAWSPASISPLRSVNNKWGGRAKVVSIRRARSFFPPLYAPPLRSLAYCWFQSSPLHQRS